MIRQLVEQDHIKKRLMYLDPAVITYESERTKAIHKEADTGPGSADHFRQCLLRNRRDKRFWSARLAELRHQEKYPSQALFA